MARVGGSRIALKILRGKPTEKKRLSRLSREQIGINILN